RRVGGDAARPRHRAAPVRAALRVEHERGLRPADRGVRAVNVLVFGAGAVGSTVGGWLAEKHPKTWLLDVPATVTALEEGLTLYEGDPAKARRVPVNAVSDLAAAPRPDLVIVAVKTYSLEKVCGLLRERLGDAPIVLALQNGVDNQAILPRFFSKA